MATVDLDGTEQPMDPMLVKAIETAFLAFSLPAVEFTSAPRSWKKSNPTGGTNGPRASRKAAIKLELIERDGFRCAYCSRAFIDLDDATLDHVIPNCVVGHWSPWNLVLSCDPCNNVKGDQIPAALLPMLSHLLAILTTPDMQAAAHFTTPTPTSGFPTKSAARRVRKAARKAAWLRRQVDQALDVMGAPPVRPAIEAAPVRTAIPAGQGGTR